MRVRMSSRVPIAGLFVLAVAFALASVPALADTVTFEPPTYPAVSSFISLDGWHKFGGADLDYLVTSSSGTETRVLSGTQSGAIVTNGGIAYRHFAGTGTELVDGYMLSWLMSVDGTSGTGEVWFSQNATALKTPGGIAATPGGTFSLFGASAAPPGSAVYIDSGVSCVAGNKYQIDMVLDFTHQRFQGYSTDITGSGSRTSLGTAYFAEAFTASDAAANGGYFLYDGLPTGNNVIFDNIGVVIPEPGTVTLLLTGLVGLLAYAWRRRK